MNSSKFAVFFKNFSCNLRCHLIFCISFFVFWSNWLIPIRTFFLLFFFSLFDSLRNTLFGLVWFYKYFNIRVNELTIRGMWFSLRSIFVIFI
jgi:hypothetical protein